MDDWKEAKGIQIYGLRKKKNVEKVGHQS
jgi:hypothetical protein